MNKLLLLLLMPFFIGCGNDAADKDDMAAGLRRLMAERKIDSLVVAGSKYIWKENNTDTGFFQYIRLNGQIADSLEGFAGIDRIVKYRAANVFLENIIRHEQVLSNDSSMHSILVNAFYQYAVNWTYIKDGYCEEEVAAYEKCLLYQDKWALLDSSDYFYTCRDLGIQYHKLGEKEKAANYYSKAVNYYNRNAALSAKRVKKIASAFINSLIFFNEYKLYDSVLAHAKGVLELDSMETQKAAQIRAAYAQALYAKNNPAYKLQLAMAWDSLEKIPHPVNGDILGKRSDVLKLKGQIALKEQKYDEAITLFRRALDTCLKKNSGNKYERSSAKLLLDIANVLDSTRQYDSALNYCQQALACVTRVDPGDIRSNPKKEELYTENTIMEALDAKARLLQKKYEAKQDTALLANAVTCYNLAFEVERKLTDNFTYDTSRAAMQQQSKIRSSAAIKNCYALYSIAKENKWAEMAFQFSENSKALLLLESVKKNIYYNTYLKGNPLLKTLDSLKLLAAYTEKQLQENTRNILDTALVSRKKLLSEKVDEALLALDAANLSAKNLEQQAKPDLLPRLRENLLNSNCSLVEFFSNDRDNYVFIVNQSADIGFYQLDSTVTASVDSFRHFFDNAAAISNNPAGYKQAAYHLYKTACLHQVPAAITGILLVPDGSFSQLPFDALLTENDASAGFKKAPYLLNRFTISSGYSAASLLQQYDNNSSTNNTLAAFAPVFEKGQRNLSPLPNTREEVTTIDADSVYQDSNATVASFRYSLTHAGMLHLATHAGLDSSGTKPRLEFIDSIFETNELYALRLNTNLVMLNACQTNKGIIHESEGPMSLARGFYYAGAKNVVASLWNVDDSSGAKIAANFYKQAKNNGNNFGAALQKAKKDFLESEASGSTYSPYYWAALMHIGSTPVKKIDSALLRYGLATGVILLLLMFFIARKRKKVHAASIDKPAVSRLARASEKAK
jgi:CHAT domain-containing protein